MVHMALVVQGSASSGKYLSQNPEKCSLTLSLADIAATESSTTQMEKRATMDGNSMEHPAILAQRTAQPLHTSVVCVRDILSLARFIG
jgi:hypothetical protein